MNVFYLYVISAALFFSGNHFPDAFPARTQVADPSPHPMYVSVSEFAFNQKESILEVSCKMFADDCENTLRQQSKTNVDLTHPKDAKQLDKLINEYIQKHLQLKINGKPVSMQYVGYEKENESVWCYMQVNEVKSVKKLEAVNTLLYDLYNTQIGIMHTIVGGNRKSIRVNYPDSNAVFEF